MSAESERIVKQEITHHTLQDGSTRAVLISQKNNGKEHVLIIDTTKGRPLRVINGAFRLKIVTTKAVESKS